MGNNSSQPAGIGGIATVTYSLVQMQGTGVYQGMGNINQNPSFINAANPKGADTTWFTVDDGLSISCTSPAIDAGDDNQILTGSKDITGITNRITKNHVDMGAYEFPSTDSLKATAAAITCTVSSITLTATGGTSYSWSTGATTPSIVVNSPNTYTVSIVNGNCITTMDTTITQSFSPPNVGVVATPAVHLCPGVSVTLSDTGAASYLWNNGIIDGVPFIPTDTTTYTVIATGANGCTASTTYTVYMSETPIITINGANTLMCSVQGISYQWLLNGNPIQGATSQYYYPMQNGQYTVMVTTNVPCTSTSAPFNMTTVGVEDVILRQVSIYPNPFKDKLFIENLPLGVNMSLQSIMGGKILWENTGNDKVNESLDLSQLPVGVYVLSIEYKGEKFARKVVKE